MIAGEAHEQERALPRVEVIEVGRSRRARAMLQLPGNIQAITEAPILARADGYVLRRMVDIGDRVQAGQTVAEIEAPEMDAADSSVEGQSAAGAGGGGSGAGQSTTRVSPTRNWLASRRSAGPAWRPRVWFRGRITTSIRASISRGSPACRRWKRRCGVQRSNVAAAEANLARIERMQSYRMVKAPFDGVITLRNVDVGALVNAGNTLLFRIAQTGTLRTYVNVPQTHASSVRPGQTARLSVSNLPGRQFTGTVARTANALDPASRTLLVEVHVPNHDGALLPGHVRAGRSDQRREPMRRY